MSAPEDPIHNLVDTPPRLPEPVRPLELAGLTILPVGMMSWFIPGDGYTAALLSLATMSVMSRGADVWIGPLLDRWVRRGPRRRRTD
jgi:hypothetical protein